MHIFLVYRLFSWKIYHIWFLCAFEAFHSGRKNIILTCYSGMLMKILFMHLPRFICQGSVKNMVEQTNSIICISLISAPTACHIVLKNWVFKKKSGTLWSAFISYDLWLYGRGRLMQWTWVFIGRFDCQCAGKFIGLLFVSLTRPGRKIDFKWDYGFNPQDSDFTTDYEDTKYLYALKLNGF